MALRALVLRKKLEIKKNELETLRSKDADFETREAELSKAVEEIDDETPEDDKKVVEDEVEKFDRDKKDHEESKAGLEEEIKNIEKEIEADEKQQRKSVEPKVTEGRENKEMLTRTKFFGMDMQERRSLFEREDVRNFIGNVRSCIKERRALTNVGITIPDVLLPLIKQTAEESSKLIKYVTVRRIGGTSRQNIMGEIPEAYWDEMCAALKEMDLSFYNMEMDGYKVSGFFAVCNAVLEDTDINLMEELISAIGKAIAKALDKSILYGKNVKMPMGIVTSLLTKTAPEGYPATGRPWKDLSTSNIITGASASGIKLFQDIVKNTGVIDNDYDTGAIVWIMNKRTKTLLISESMNVNAAAAITAGMGNSMPVIGGDIVEFKFIPDNTIIFGYLKNYTLIERAGMAIGQSEHIRFLDDQTVFKGTARYDGDLAIREAFAIYGVGGAPNTTAPLFAGETPTEG